jgi:hypothetical protein
MASGRVQEFMALYNNVKEHRIPTYGWMELNTREKFRAIKTRLSADVDRHVNTLSIAPQCQYLIKNMQHKLPLELRKMVYEYLLRGSVVEITNTNLDLDSRSTKTKPRLPAMRLAKIGMYKYFLQHDSKLENFKSTGLDLDHFSTDAEPWFPPKLLAKLEYAHLLLADDTDATTCWEFRDTRREFAHAWYRSTHFRFGTSNYIRSFSSIDRWGTGYIISDLIQSIDFALAVEIPRRRTVDMVLGDVYKQPLVLQWEPLLKMRRLARLELFMHHERFLQDDLTMRPTAPETWNKVAIVEYLAAIFPSLTTLLDAGCEIKIVVDRCTRFEVKKGELTVQHWITEIWGTDSN